MVAERFWFEGDRLSLNFIGTSGTRRGELLPDSASLGEWLVAAGLSERRLGVSRAELAQTHVLRRAVLGLVKGCLGNGGFREADVRVLNAAAGQRAPVRQLVLREGDLAVRERTPSLAQCLAAVARDAIDLVTGPERRLLRECAAQDCSGIYVDRSRAATRKWCAAAGCGNRARVAVHRSHRQATALDPDLGA